MARKTQLIKSTSVTSPIAEDSRLSDLKTLFAAGQFQEIVEQIDTVLIKATPPLEKGDLHAIRFDALKLLLVEDVKWVRAVLDSISVLSEALPTLSLPLLEEIHGATSAHVERIMIGLAENPVRVSLAEVDALNLLVDHFAEIQMLSGIVQARLTLLLKKKLGTSEQYYKLRREIDIYKIECDNQNRAITIEFDSDASAKIAVNLLEKRISQVSKDHVFYLLMLHHLAPLYELHGKLDEALEIYEQIQILGGEVPQRLEALLPAAIQRYQAKFGTGISMILEAGNLDRAIAVLDQLPSLLFRIPDFAVWQADIAFLSERFSDALNLYLAIGEYPADLKQGIVLFKTLREVQLFVPDNVNVPENADGLAYPGKIIGFDDGDIPHRVIAGKLMTYLALDRLADADGLIAQLLDDSTLKKNHIDFLFSMLQSHHHAQDVLRCQQLRQVASGAFDNKEWGQAKDLFLELNTFTASTPNDRAWLALAMFKDGDTAETVGHMLRTLDLNELSASLLSEMVELFRWLGKAGQWEVVSRFAERDPALADVRSQYIATEIENGWNALASAQFEKAEVCANQVLYLVPHHASGRLLLARAITRTRIGDARGILQDLIKEKLVVQEASIALAEIEIAAGHIQAAQALIQALDSTLLSPAAQTMSLSLANQIAQRPAIQISHVNFSIAIDTLRSVPTDKESCMATFAFKLDRVRAMRTTSALEKYWENTLVALWNQADTASTETHYAWRYLSHDGTLDLFLIARVEASNEQNTLQAAGHLIQLLTDVLAIMDGYNWQPVYSLAKLQAILNTGEITEAYEIARRELTFSTSPTAVESEDEWQNLEFYAVYPYPDSVANLRAVLDILIKRPNPAILNIHFSPTRVMPWERTQIENMNREPGYTVTTDDMPQSKIKIKLETTIPDSRQQLSSALHTHFLDRTSQSMAYIVQIQIALTAQPDSALPHLIAASMFGAANYEIISAQTEQERQIVQQNLREISCERWIYSAAPEGLMRARHLVTIHEAHTVTIPPISGGIGLPGIKTNPIRETRLPNHLSQEGVIIGESAVADESGNSPLIRLSAADRQRHTYVVGKTGTGKTTLLKQMISADIEAGYGMAVFDPHGDLIRDILQTLPPHRMHDVVFFNPADREHYPSINIMDVSGIEEASATVSEFLSQLERLYDPHQQGFLGPRFHNIVRNSMLALIEGAPGSTLVDLVKFIGSNKEWRDKIIEKVRDPIVLNYWTEVGKDLDKFGWNSNNSEMKDWLLAKFSHFVDDAVVRRIIGQPKTSINFRQIMDEKKIFLADISKGSLGAKNSQFIGLLLVSRLVIAALGRVKQSSVDRVPFYVYLDEFQNFTNVDGSFGTLLSETRKYGICLTLANQYTAQLDDRVREAIFGNVGNLLAFTTGIKDAVYLAPQMYPFEPDDLVNLPRYHMLAKTVDSFPFLVRTLAETRAPNPRVANLAIEHSRARYTRGVLEIDTEIRQRLAPHEKGS